VTDPGRRVPDGDENQLAIFRPDAIQDVRGYLIGTRGSAESGEHHTNESNRGHAGTSKQI